MHIFQGHHSQQQKLHWSNWSGGRSNGHAVSDAPSSSSSASKEASLLKDASAPRPPARSRAAAEIQVMTAKVEEVAPPQPRHIPGLDFAATDNAAKRSSASQKKKRKRKSTATKENSSDNARPLPAAAPQVTILSRKQSLQTDSSTASGCGTPTVLLATPPSEAVEQLQEEEEVRKGLQFHYLILLSLPHSGTI